MDDGYSRRSFLGAGMTAAAAAAWDASLAAQEKTSQPSGTLPLTITAYPYERVRALQDGRVRVAGCQLTFEPDKISLMNQHIFNGPKTRDVSEVGLIPFLLAFCNGEFRDYQLLPVFPLKTFRHKSLFVHTDRGIRQPEDLRGRKVATVGYSSSSLTWIRGILQDEYGVKPEEIHWVVTSKDSGAAQTGKTSKWEKVLPANLKITKAPADKDESQLLLEGEVDAIFHPAEPQAYVERHPKVQRLFPDSRTVERDYYKKTGIFPIMHAVAIRRDLAKQEPWLANAVFEAFSKAKELDYEESRKLRWAYSSLPWYGQEFNETVELMGENFYSYGIKDNRKALESVCRYVFQQGLAKRQPTFGELFVKSTLEMTDVIS